MFLPNNILHDFSTKEIYFLPGLTICFERFRVAAMNTDQPSGSRDPVLWMGAGRFEKRATKVDRKLFVLLVDSKSVDINSN